MARRRPPWQVGYDPKATRYAFFVSHVAEDAREVAELKEAIASRSVRSGRPPLQCFLDLHDWPSGRNSGHIIRAALLESFSLVTWVTPHYLANQRGWIWYELAYAELIERSLNAPRFENEHPFITPIFRGVTVEQVERTPLLEYWGRKLFLPQSEVSIPEVARSLVDLYDRESKGRGVAVTPGDIP